MPADPRPLDATDPAAALREALEQAPSSFGPFFAWLDRDVIRATLAALDAGPDSGATGRLTGEEATEVDLLRRLLVAITGSDRMVQIHPNRLVTLLAALDRLAPGGGSAAGGGPHSKEGQ